MDPERLKALEEIAEAAKDVTLKSVAESHHGVSEPFCFHPICKLQAALSRLPAKSP